MLPDSRMSDGGIIRGECYLAKLRLEAFEAMTSPSNLTIQWGQVSFLHMYPQVTQGSGLASVQHLLLCQERACMVTSCGTKPSWTASKTHQ